MQIKKQIDSLHEIFPTYGRHNVWHVLKDEIPALTEKQIRRIMHKYRLYPVYCGPNTSGPSPENRKYPYLLRNKVIRYPNQVWCTDITYIKVAGGTVYLMAVTNRPMFTKDFIAAELAIKTLKTLPKGLRKKVKKNILLHSDQCSQYTSKEFTDFCKAAGITQNMSKAGYPYDNAPMKRYFNSLKNELICFYHYRTEEALYSAVENYAYVYYNNMRPLSANNHLTPFEKRYEKLGHAVTKLLNQNNNTNIDLIFF